MTHYLQEETVTGHKAFNNDGDRIIIKKDLYSVICKAAHER